MKLVILGVLGVVVAACGDNDIIPDAPPTPPTTIEAFTMTNLVSNAQDPILINAWGIVPGEQGFWIAANGTGKVAIYDANGLPASGDYVSGKVDLGVGITGLAKNPTTDQLLITANGKTAAAAFVFASENGTLIGWTDVVDAVHGVPIVTTKDAIYKGVALTSVRGAVRMFATDFHHGRVDVFDSRFQHVAADFTDPNLPAGFAPFGIAAINGKVFVTFALQDDTAHDEIDGAGLGFVDAFDVDGTLLQRIASAGPLNAPWGVALAPSSFGRFPNALLVGNFGDGKITAFDPSSGSVQGQLDDTNSNPLVVHGLWGITFGDDKQAGSSNTLYFAAGPNSEMNGLFGSIFPTTSTIP